MAVKVYKLCTDTLNTINLQTALHFNSRGSVCTQTLANRIGLSKQAVLLASS